MSEALAILARQVRELGDVARHGSPPIIGILLSIIAIAGWLFLATLFHRDNNTNSVRVDPANVQVPSAQ